MEILLRLWAQMWIATVIHQYKLQWEKNRSVVTFMIADSGIVVIPARNLTPTLTQTHAIYSHPSQTIP